MSTPTNHDDLKKDFENLFKPRSEDIEVKHDALMLMAAFLSEIEYIQDQDGISSKFLADKIDLSPSYLCQVFRSKKPLNFLTLAKIKRVLNIGFEVKAFRMNTVYNPIHLTKFATDYLSQQSDIMPQIGSKFYSKDFSSTDVNVSEGKDISTSNSQKIEKYNSVLS